MKKKTGIAAIVLALGLSLTGCSQEKMVDYDQDSLEQQSDVLVQIFESMDEESKEQFNALSDYRMNTLLLNSGLDMEPDTFLAAIETWGSATEEYGAFVEHEPYEIEVNNQGVRIHAEATFESRSATITFAYDEHSKLDSLAVDGHYKMSEILEKAGLNTLLGMGTVFVVLIFIAFMISLLGYIPKLQDKFRKKEEPEVKSELILEEAMREPEDLTEDLELIAVVAAAIAASEGVSTDDFVVRSIKRKKGNRWN